MKKYLIVLGIAMLLLEKANCQLEKGNWLIGGSGNYSNYKSKGNNAINSKIRILEISPDIGYFIDDQIATGIKLNLNFSKAKYPQIDGSTTSSTQNKIGFGPFVRYYFLAKEKAINVFFDAGTYFNFYTSKNFGNSRTTSKDFQYSIFGGAVAFLNSSVGIEILLGYVSNNTIRQDSRVQLFQLKIGTQIHLEN